MADWSAGYVADVGYTYGYYSELNPLRARFVLASAGLSATSFTHACELGFGQGVSVNIHAAASTTSWYGTDFNPSQAALAQEMARATGASAQLYDDAFADFAQRSDLPDFDFIGLHGIWSWISERNRALIVDFISRRLKVGGVLYISCNTYPGWAAFGPLRHLMTEHATVLGPDGRGTVSRVDSALEFAEKLLATQPAYLRANPQMRDRLEAVRGQSRQYLAHEYFNRDWHPMHFSTLAELLGPAKLQFACSAHYLDHVEGVNVTPSQSAFLKEIPDQTFRETVRDFMINQQFRRDYWIKGSRRLNTVDQLEELRRLSIMLAVDPASISLKIKSPLGEMKLSERVYNPILDAIGDYSPKSIAELEQILKSENLTFNQLMQAIFIILDQGWAIPTQDEASTEKVRMQCDRLNAYLLSRARGSGEIGHLASPVTGGGVALARSSQLMLLALNSGYRTPNELAEFALNSMQSHGQKLLKAGRAIENDELRAELLTQAQIFTDKQVALLKALRICK